MTTWLISFFRLNKWLWHDHDAWRALSVQKNTIFFSVLLGLAFLTLGVPSLVLAEELTSHSYIIQFGNFNMGAGKREGDLYNVSYTLGQTAAGPYGEFGAEGSTYFVGAGFQYIYQIGSFGFSISDTDLDLGLLSPGIHNTASNTLTISTRGAGGYSVYTYEQYRLALQGGLDWIDDTTCDPGYTCSVNSAKPWVDQNQPGFGYNAQGDSVSSDFTAAGNPDCSSDSECFRPFADASQGGSMQLVMSDTKITKNQQALITYKAGAAGD
ncbi:MAG TPA: hypothetical protein PLM16_02505, partial [Candidatus Woesebacteria bacterium]|nr:hypothetical protein [Candidatus Woesebacteria bacterium]